jgi:hypothetical protein
MGWFGPKCANFGCWNYTGHRSGLCPDCRRPDPAKNGASSPNGEAVSAGNPPPDEPLQPPMGDGEL